MIWAALQFVEDSAKIVPRSGGSTRQDGLRNLFFNFSSKQIQPRDLKSHLTAALNLAGATPTRSRASRFLLRSLIICLLLCTNQKC